jgi:DNA repair exonuclease SbcCD ATPase subunit
MQLEELLGEELYAKVKAKIDEKNANEPDKLKHVRYADLSEGGYVSKAKYDTDLAEKKNLEEQLKTLNGTIKELQDSNKDNTQLQDTIAQLKKDLAQKQTENQNMVKTYALKEQLTKAGVLDADYLIYRHGGIDKFNFDKDNNPIGVEDAIKPYKADTTMAHLFKTEEKTTPYSPTGGSGGSNKNPFAKDTYNMTEQAQLFKANPEQARAMAAAAGVTI